MGRVGWVQHEHEVCIRQPQLKWVLKIIGLGAVGSVTAVVVWGSKFAVFETTRSENIWRIFDLGRSSDDSLEINSHGDGFDGHYLYLAGNRAGNAT